MLFPSWHQPGTRLPVLMDPYGGPHHQRVMKATGAFLASQWLAEQGFAVVVADGRGTGGRGPAWDRAVAGDLATGPLEDQVTALQAAAEAFADLDTERVAIRGWSFGGYLSALALLRRPDVFHAAIVGAPVTDWRLYDTFYTERYLGDPTRDAAPYEQSSIISDPERTEATARRPLLIIHGLADDNVFVAHSLRLSSALLAAGYPHSVLPLSGVTHMTPQEVVAENMLMLQVDFLKQALGCPAGLGVARLAARSGPLRSSLGRLGHREELWGTGDAAVTQGTEEARRTRQARGDGSRLPARGGAGAAARSARPAARRPRSAAAAVGGALLFLGYLRVSWTVAATSDGAAQALQARDMLAGNWLLHGWTLSDVSFYTTELPEYVLVEAIRPFGLGVIHVAAAATTRCSCWPSSRSPGGARAGARALLRGVLAAVIMLAPQLGYGAFVLLLSPDHVGTQVPLLLGWLLLDLAPRRWWVPAILCLLLAVVQFADRVALLTAVLPLIVVCAVTLARRRPRLPGQPASGLAGGPRPAGSSWRWSRRGSSRSGSPGRRRGCWRRRAGSRGIRSR